MVEYGQGVSQGSGGGAGGGGVSGGGNPFGEGSHDVGGQFVAALSDTANQVAGLPLWAQLLLLIAVVVVSAWILRRAF